MYTVIFQTPETAQLCGEYRRILFDRFIEDGQVDFCTWIRTGDTVDTAIPGLYDLIAGKREWRAIIIQGERDRAAAPESAESNPFDYLENSDKNVYSVWESQIPLIRLAQLLGGVPEPILEFEEKREEEDGMYTRTIYHPKRSQEAINEHRRLSEKYQFCETRPKELVLVSTRQPVDNTEREIDAAWRRHMESESSEFWCRNRYPSISRFIAVDVLNTRHSLYSGSIFKLWLVVLLLSINRIDSSTLQAYRLYRASVDLDTDALSRDFSTQAAALQGVQSLLDEAERNVPTLETQASSEMPPLEAEVSVSFTARHNSNLYIRTNQLGLARDCPENEETSWNRQFQTATVAINDLIRSPQKMLDIAADDTRTRGVYPHIEVELLNRYQREEMREVMEQTYVDVLMARSRLHRSYKRRKQEREIINTQVQARIRQRVTKKAAICWGFGALGIALLAFAPYLIDAAKVSSTAFLWALVPLLGVLLLGMLFGLAELWIQRKEMADAMLDHNRCTHEIVNEIQSSAQTYTEFLSATCTYLRGTSYLQQERALRTSAENVHLMRRSHRKTVDRCMTLLRTWSLALGAKLDPAYAIEPQQSFDPTVEPDRNTTYRLEPMPEPRKIPINRTGEQINAPFDFIQSLNLEREELYDNAIS